MRGYLRHKNGVNDEEEAICDLSMRRQVTQRQCQLRKVRGGAARRSSTSRQHSPVFLRNQPVYWSNYLYWCFIVQKKTRIMLMLLSSLKLLICRVTMEALARAASYLIRWRRIAGEKDRSTPELGTRLHVSSEIASAKALRMLSVNVPALLPRHLVSCN
jgi:hypothetical protein